MNRLVGILDSLKPEINEFALETIDISQHPEQALQYQVLTTPTLVINETIVLRGIPKREKLLSSLKQAARQ